jgi:hypothetical protein
VASVSPKDIWDSLEAAGASAVQAAGIMGNAIHESDLNPEARAVDSNGYYSNGLWQFNEDSYPDSGELVTGNPVRDLAAQVNYLMQHGGLQAASGTTVSETASNFAANFERCQGCQDGGSQNAARVASAATVAGWASSGGWPASTGSAADTAELTSAEVAESGAAQAECAWAIGWGGIPDTSWLQRLFSLGSSSGNVGGGEVCLLSKSQARALIGAWMLLGGAAIALTGAAWLVKGAALAALVPALARLPGAGSTPPTAPGGGSSPAAAPSGTVADSRGTSPEFRARYLAGS